MAALRAAKRALRTDLKRRLTAVSDHDRHWQSAAVSHMLFSHPRFVGAQRVAVFLSLKEEVCTLEILGRVFEEKKSCFIPRYQTSSSSRSMDMLQLHSLEDMDTLPLTPWNIRQPADHDHSREDALTGGGLDLILVPGLGFDRRGGRLGRGKGFYDSYLQRCSRHPRGKPYTIGLAFTQQLCEQIPLEESDVLLDEVLYQEHH